MASFLTTVRRDAKMKASSWTPSLPVVLESLFTRDGVVIETEMGGHKCYCDILYRRSVHALTDKECDSK